MAEGEKETAPTGLTSYINTTSSSESEGGDREVTSILDVLKAPKVSVQNIKWKPVLSNRGHGRGGKRRCSSSSTRSEPKRVTPQHRLKEFPGEQLVVSSYKLFELNPNDSKISTSESHETHLSYNNDH